MTVGGSSVCDLSLQQQLEEVKGEIGLAFTKFSDFMQHKLLADVVKSSLSFSNEDDLRDEHHCYSPFKYQIDYIRNVMQIFKLFPKEMSLEIVEKVIMACGNLLKGGLSEVEKISTEVDRNAEKDVYAQQQEVMVSLILPVVQLILDCLDMSSKAIAGNENEKDVELEKLVKDCMRIFGECTTFLVSLTGVSLQKSDFLRIMGLCQKVWKFAEGIQNMKAYVSNPATKKIIETEVETVEKILESRLTSLLSSENGRSFSKFWVEIRNLGKEGKISPSLQRVPVSSNIPEIYMIFTSYLEDAWFWKTETGKAITPNLINGILQDMSSDKAETRKRAAFVLRAITTQYSQNKPIFDPSIPEVRLITLNNLGQRDYTKFWDSYFDIHDILNETQLHIVQPVLQKIQIFNNHSSNDAVLVWLPILLKKMIGHDNRTVVKEGFEKFLQTRDYLLTEENSVYRSLATKFLDDHVMPLLRDNVGWALNEPERFFKNVIAFGRFLLQLYSNIELPQFKSAEVVLDFLTSSGKCMGPHTIYFLVSALDEVIFDDAYVKTNMKEMEISPEKIKLSLEMLMNQLALLLSNNLTTVSKYFRGLLEQRCVSILAKIMPFFEKIPAIKLDSFLFMKFITFLGSLSAKVFSGERAQEKVQGIVKTLNGLNGQVTLISELTTESRMYQFTRTSLSSTSVLGLFRFMTTAFKIIDVSQNGEVTLAVENFAHLSASEEVPLGSIQGIQEFYQQAPHQTVPNTYLNMLRELCDMLSNDKDQYSLNEFMFCIRRLEILSVLPQEFLKDSNKTFPKFKISGPQKLFLLQKLHLLSKDSNGVSVENLKELLLTKSTVANTDKIDEIASAYYHVTERNLLSEFNQVQFSTYANIINHASTSSIEDQILIDLLTFILDTVEKSDSRGVVTALFLTKSITERFDYNENWEGAYLFDEIAEVGWSLVFELRKSDAFWSLIRAFVNFICCPYFLKNGILQQYADLLFEQGENVIGLPLVLVQQLVKADFPEELWEELHAILLKAALAGGPLSKNNRVSFAIWDYLSQDDDEDNDPEHFSSDCKARLMACEKIRCNIEYLLAKDETKPNGVQLLEISVISLLERNDLESISRKRYFQGSATHRIKQRIGQVLLILEPHINHDLAKTVLEKTLHSLSNDSPQPSVRYMGEWLVILIVKRYPELSSLLFDCLDDCIQKRLGFGAFFATICLQVSKYDISLQFYDRALQSLANLTLSQHLTVRIYAQIAFERIFERAQEVNLQMLVNKYAPVLFALTQASVYVSGNCSKLLENVSQDFYVNVFDSVTHYCPEVIFTHLPRLSGMIKDECILKPETIRKILRKPSHQFGSCNQSVDAIALQKIYTDHEKSAWHLKSVVADGRELGEELATENIPPSSKGSQNNAVNYQKKINPWKLLSASEEIEEYSKASSKKRCAQEEGLVVVASLLDHLPNLGGLCRTCEIFGVHKYVVNSLKVVNEQHFQSLSVSAQNWVDILEVPVRDLESFLLTYSTKGYTILGVEQANESTSLVDFTFPKKSVLLLGNEKLGIPSELLHLVDKCIEIPQVGIIRSLNVHVTGALCIWQYASQNVIL